MELLTAIGISIERESSGNQIGIYILIEKNQDEAYSLVAMNSTLIEPNDIKKQEVLFVSPDLTKVAPAFAVAHFIDSKQAYRCEGGSKFVTGFDSSYRSSYNPCDSSLTTASNIGSSVLANSLLTVLSLGTNIVSGSSITFVDTDKDKVAQLVVNSKLFQCLKEANLGQQQAENPPKSNQEKNNKK